MLQMIMLEGAKATTETVDALRTGASAMKAMQKATYVQGLLCIGPLVSFLTCYLFIQFWTASSTLHCLVLWSDMQFAFYLRS